MIGEDETTRQRDRALVGRRAMPATASSLVWRARTSKTRFCVNVPNLSAGRAVARSAACESFTHSTLSHQSIFRSIIDQICCAQHNNVRHQSLQAHSRNEPLSLAWLGTVACGCGPRVCSFSIRDHKSRASLGRHSHYISASLQTTIAGRHARDSNPVRWGAWPRVDNGLVLA